MDVIINAEEGDYISSQYGYSEFADGALGGSLEGLIPGCGYLYKSVSDKTLEFDFSKTSATTAAPQRTATRAEADEDTPVVEIHKYPNTMNITARLYDENGAEITIYGDEAAEITFLIETIAAGTTYKAAESLTFVSDMIGSRKEPYAIVVGDEITGVNSTIVVEENKRIFRLDGTLVPMNDISTLPQGTYVVDGKKVVR